MDKTSLPIIIMVREFSFILIMIVFFGAHIGFEKYIKAKKPNFTVGKVLIISLGIEAILIILAGNIEFFFHVMIYATVVIASFISVFFRNKRIIGGQKI